MHMRMLQAGVAGEMVGHGGDRIATSVAMDADGSHVGDVGAVGHSPAEPSRTMPRSAHASSARAARNFEIGFGDEAMHDLTLVELRGAEGAAGGGGDGDQLVERTPRGADRDAAVLLRHVG